MTQPKLKILHVLGQRPDATGSGIYLQSLMREAAKCGHENFMIAGVYADSEIEFHGVLPEQCCFVRFSGEDIPFPIPGMTDSMPYPSMRFADLCGPDLDKYESAFSRVLTETASCFQPDIIHSHHNWLVSSLARRLFPKIPVVTTCHGTDLRQFQNCPHLQEKVLSGCRRLDAAMVLSGEQKQFIEKHYGLPPEKVIFTGAGYNDTVFRPGVKPAPDPVQLVYAGKLLAPKGLPWLLRALETAVRSNWQLHIVGGGSGPDTDECLRLAENLDGRATVHGMIPQARLAGIFRQSHVFVLPSLFEGLPLVVLEALASGCRIVATDLPGVMEVLGDVTAEYVTLVRTPRLRNMDQPYPEDLPAFVSDLARAVGIQIARAAERPQIDLSLVKEKLATFSWQGVFERVQNVYYRVLNPKQEGGRSR